MTVSTAIELYRGDLVGRAAQVASLHRDELKRRAVEAARDKNVAALWVITEAHLTSYGTTGARISPHTLRVYREAVQAFVAHAADQAVSLLNPDRTVGPLYLRRLEAAGRSPATVRVKLAGARALYRALRWAGATDVDPFIDAQAARDLTPAWDKRQPYSEDEVQRLLRAADPRMQALLLLCAHAGLRISEALALTWADVDLGARVVTVINGKGRKSRRVNMSRSLVDALETLGSGTGPVIGGGADAARERLGWVCRRAHVEPRGYHALRHYAGTRLLREGQSLDAAARHLGHASIETTRIYAKWADDGLKSVLSSW
ncbi:integrase/recombinase XerC [Deinococcus metalli]|uniref:Integrase n=1 Tax=Deinococcus metalli TaxID=1141878 RepID=A0A7W8KIX0_9DEIO|nr:tyrosine-type recombinase/integrase [Deinococcus metalli]MBB5379000.1 integrase/recombinase XerC [Deinococcus metalli]GHF63467.1 integrase [Deinococcus metalli]